ncbi:MAG: P-loop NTPase family protein, partial [Thermoplasmatota archaeon]
MAARTIPPEKILKAFPSEEAFEQAVREGDLARLEAIEGVSAKRAVDLVLAARGESPSEFLRTPRAEVLYEDILDRITAFANVDDTRARIRLLAPLRDAQAIEARRAQALAAAARVSTLQRDEVAALLAKLHRPREPRPKFDASVVVLVDSHEDRQALAAAGVDRLARVTVADDGGEAAEIDGAELLVYAYSHGKLDLTGAENVLMVPFTRDVAALLPDAALAYFRENRALFEHAGALAALLGRESVAPQLLEELKALREAEGEPFDLEALARAEAERINADLKSRTGSLALTGDEVLEMMAGRTPRKVRDAQAEVLSAGRARLRDATGEDFHVFTDGFPVRVDDAALERRAAEWAARRRRNELRDKANAARRLLALKSRVEREIRELIAFDHEFAIGAFVLHYELVAPTRGRGIVVEGALHLELAGKRDGTRIDYELGRRSEKAKRDGVERAGASSEHRVALLTGANSGGKTTLLETLGQAVLLHQLGFPVNARESSLEIVDELYFFTQKRSLDAGAFESFLKGFIPIVTSKAKKLVLADELEAMTELEAASRIVGTFVELLKDTGSLGVCVTHMADEVGKHTTVRVDGIEARGLDEEGNLIVDRTPRLDYRARSTPELILRRLAGKASGEERKVYELILSKF